MDKLMDMQMSGWMGGKEEGNGRRVGYKNGCSMPKGSRWNYCKEPSSELTPRVSETATCRTLHTSRF